MSLIELEDRLLPDVSAEDHHLPAIPGDTRRAVRAKDEQLQKGAHVG